MFLISHRLKYSQGLGSIYTCIFHAAVVWLKVLIFFAIQAVVGFKVSDNSEKSIIGKYFLHTPVVLLHFLSSCDNEV